MKEKFVKIGWYLVIWFLFMIFTVVMTKPLADNGFPVPTSSIFINTIICFLIPYLIYRKFMNYKATHEIKIKNIFVGLAIYFFVIVVLAITLHDGNNSYNTADEIKTEKIENIDDEKNFDEEEKLAAEKKAEEEKLAAEKKAAEEKLAAEKKAEEEKILAEQKAREEQEKLAAQQAEQKNSEPGLIDKAKEKIQDVAENLSDKESKKDKIYVGRVNFLGQRILDVEQGVDLYVLPSTAKKFIEGIIFQDHGYRIDVLCKKAGTDEICYYEGTKIPLTFRYRFYNELPSLADEEKIEFDIIAVADTKFARKWSEKQILTKNETALSIFEISKEFFTLTLPIEREEID